MSLVVAECGKRKLDPTAFLNEAYATGARTIDDITRRFEKMDPPAPTNAPPPEDFDPFAPTDELELNGE